MSLRSGNSQLFFLIEGGTCKPRFRQLPVASAVTSKIKVHPTFTDEIFSRPFLQVSMTNFQIFLQGSLTIFFRNGYI